MASSKRSACEVCMAHFNEGDKKEVMLPCNHSFCLTCLFRLQMSGSRHCLRCKEDWSHFDILAVAGSFSARTFPNEHDKSADSCGTKPVANNMRVGHSLFKVYWCKHLKEIGCKKCVVEKQKVCSSVELIEDTLHLIKADADDMHAELKTAYRCLTTKLEKDIEEALIKKKKLRESKMKIEIQENANENKLQTMALSQSSNEEFLCKLDDVKKKMHQSSVDDIAKMMNCYRDTVLMFKSQAKESVTSVEGLRLSLSDLNIEESESTRFSPNSWADMINLRYERRPCSCTKSWQLLSDGGVIGSFNEEAVAVAKALAHNGTWIVDETNYMGAIIALLDKSPARLQLTIPAAVGGEGIPLLALNTLAKGLKNCSLSLRFYDSFYKPGDPMTDAQRLQEFVANARVKICSFRGYLDTWGMKQLVSAARCAAPDCSFVRDLGLAVAIEDDVQAINNYTNLCDSSLLSVSVSLAADPRKLCPLDSEQDVRLVFHEVTDTNVHLVRPLINVLVPSQRLKELRLPRCLVSPRGVRALAQALKGLQVAALTLDLRGRMASKTMMKSFVAGNFYQTLGPANIEYKYCDSVLNTKE